MASKKVDFKEVSPAWKVLQMVTLGSFKFYFEEKLEIIIF